MTRADWPGDDPSAGPDDILYWLWLARALGPASLYAGCVLDRFGDARSAWEARETDAFREAVGENAALAMDDKI